MCPMYNRPLPRWGEREGGRQELYMCVRCRTDLSQSGVRVMEEGRSSICVFFIERLCMNIQLIT